MRGSIGGSWSSFAPARVMSTSRRLKLWRTHSCVDALAARSHSRTRGCAALRPERSGHVIWRGANAKHFSCRRTRRRCHMRADQQFCVRCAGDFIGVSDCLIEWSGLGVERSLQVLTGGAPAAYALSLRATRQCLILWQTMRARKSRQKTVRTLTRLWQIDRCRPMGFMAECKDGALRPRPDSRRH